MVSTKAFGMGVDISDIQVVYHHAPSGLLPDYVQEIGRVARDPKIKGFATLNYSEQDQRFSKALHGMSALRQHQIREVLQKIFKAYVKNESRNLLLSIDYFGHIF
jgi:superfamily II DNA helicase RecQ